MNAKLRRTLERMYHKVVTATFTVVGRLPKRELFFFESFHGRQYSDNPRAIYEYIQSQHPEANCIWAGKKGFEQPFIDNDVPYVRRMGLNWLLTMPRAKYWIFNTRMPKWMKKTAGTTFVQTWHGTPLKRLGLDIQQVNMPDTDTQRYRENFRQESARWDYLISPNAYSTAIFKRAFAYDGPVLEIGYPRNDILQDEEHLAANRRHVLQKLGLKEDQKIILYAPTWRDNQFHKKGAYKYDNQFPFADVLALDSEIVVLLRTHYLVVDAFDIDQYQGRVLDCGKYPDIRDLYLISDLLITDYSSVMFDYAFTKRQMLFYMYDEAEYNQEIRGFYFDPQKELPGAIVADKKELVAEIDQQLVSPISPPVHPRCQAFYDKYCLTEQGTTASERLLATLTNQDKGERQLGE